METSDTILFDKIIFGPVKSRRLGLSLGINLLPTDSKLCNFDCIYCECGWSNIKGTKKYFHPRAEVSKSLEETLIRLKTQNIIPDAITFAGNGEPTMHPDFLKIINDTIYIRNKYFPETKIVVLTNAVMLNKIEVVEALKKADMRILKLDAGTEDTFQKINQPIARRSLRWIVDHLKYFKNDLIVQTLFVKGNCKGKYVDNTTDDEINAWLELIKEINPKQVMIYSIDRTTAERGLEKISFEKLSEIALKVTEMGIDAMVS